MPASVCLPGREKQTGAGHYSGIGPRPIRSKTRSHSKPLRVLTEDLALQAIGVAIRAAKTEEEATKAFKPYADQLAR
jgi:hypothetical protein